MTGRYVVLGLAAARSPWFRDVASWAHAGAVPVEFVKVVSAVELRAHLRTGRPFSAVVVDGALRSLDRDLVDEATAAGCAVIVVDDARVRRDWAALGASAALPPVFDRKDLLDALAAWARPITRADAVPSGMSFVTTAGWRARAATVVGPGGTGASTVAIALAQGLADDVANGGLVLLADLARNGEQAMLHDARDVVPGVQELVEAHRTGRPSVEEVRALTFFVEARRYHLLLGLRRSRSWPALRPRAFEAALDSVSRAWRAVVFDADADLEGESWGGSADVEDRNVMARRATLRADVVFAVGQPGMKGLHSLVRVVGDLLDHGVDARRIVPVLNRAPKPPRVRAGYVSALAELLAGRTAELASPVFLPERRAIDDMLRDGVRLPSPLVEPLVGAFSAILRRVEPNDASVPEPVRVEPGTLGSWSP